MRIITLTCGECGTVVAANELEDRRVTKCPGLRCETVLRFDDLTQEEQNHYLENWNQYQI